MKQKRWTVTAATLLLATLVFAGFLAIAAEYGTQDDPLVSLSYINNVLAPETLKKVDAIIAQKTDELSKTIDQKIAAYSTEVDGKIADQNAKTTGDIMSDGFIQAVANKVVDKVGAQQLGTGTFALVKLTNGKTLTAKVGTEVLLRIGNAVCVASGSPGLIDMTTGGDLKNGTALEKNHLYLSTIDGRGVKAASDVTVLVRGSYTIK